MTALSRACDPPPGVQTSLENEETSLEPSGGIRLRRTKRSTSGPLPASIQLSPPTDFPIAHRTCGAGKSAIVNMKGSRNMLRTMHRCSAGVWSSAVIVRGWLAQQHLNKLSAPAVVVVQTASSPPRNVRHTTTPTLKACTVLWISPTAILRYLCINGTSE